ncbi:MAG TPA: response regulator [Planctomycetota bacterium]
MLCVDDDPPVLAAIRRLLRHEPYDVLSASDPLRALEMIGEREIDLVIADQRMPSMMGTELLKAIRERSPATVGVILTGHADLTDIADAMTAGAVDRLIKKPWDDAGFRELIASLIEEGRDAGRPEPPPRTPAADRPVHTIECDDRLADKVLSDLSEFLHGPEGPPTHAVIVFDHLLRLRGSVTALMSDVVREIVRSGTRAALVDGTGAAGVFLELVGGSLPVVVYRSRDEMSDPKHILVVEDSEDSLDYLQVLLQSAGHTCEAVTSVTEAVARLKTRAYDLVLLDLVLPDADGVEVARHVLEGGMRTPIIAISGFIDRSREREYEGLGIRRQLSKPYRPREILDAIRDS